MSKKHHYVPRSVLRRFSSTPDGTKIYVFDKLKRNTFEAAIADVGAENHFNTAQIGKEAVNFEDMFGVPDSRLADLVTRITQERTIQGLNTSEIRDIALLALIQFFRVKLRRSTLESFPGQLRAVLTEAGVEPSQGVLPDITPDQAKVMTLAMIADAKEYVPSIVSKDWALQLATPAQPFWISDNPITPVNILPFGDSGLTSPGVLICWPLSYDIALTFACPTLSAKYESKSPERAAILRGRVTFPYSEQNVIFQNSLQVLQSSRWVYGPTSDFAFAERILKDHPEAAENTSTVSIPPMGTISPNKRMGPGTYLVAFGAKTHHSIPLKMWSHEIGDAVVEVEPGASSALAAAASDLPHSIVQVYVDGVPVLHYGQGIIEVDAKNEHVAVLAAADPGIRKMMNRK